MKRVAMTPTRLRCHRLTSTVEAVAGEAMNDSAASFGAGLTDAIARDGEAVGRQQRQRQCGDVPASAADVLQAPQSWRP
jgi:hypothetical protein